MKRRFRIGFLCAIIFTFIALIGNVKAERVELNEINSKFGTNDFY